MCCGIFCYFAEWFFTVFISVNGCVLYTRNNLSTTRVVSCNSHTLLVLARLIMEQPNNNLITHLQAFYVSPMSDQLNAYKS